MDPLAAALDALHAADPERDGGRPAEAMYADYITGWVNRLVMSPSAALRLAARAQHLERWAIPRSSFPLDKAGYHRWRKAVQVRQGERAQETLLAAGAAAELATRVGRLVGKAAPAGDPEAQALEDAACLVFLDQELPGFAAAHPDYTIERWHGIVQKTWRKMSPDAHTLALGLPLRADLKAIVVAAISALPTT